MRADKGAWQAFVFIDEKREWAGKIGDDPLGPKGLADAIDARIARHGKRPIWLYSDPRCPDETRQVFESAVEAVAKKDAVELHEELLCNPEDFRAKREQIHDEEVGEYRDVALYGSLARFAWALALGLLVWQADVRTKGARGVPLVAAGQLILALGQVVAIPVLYYIEMMPEERYFKNPFLRLAENAAPYVWLLYSSAGILSLGGLLGYVGLVLAPDAPDEGPKAAVGYVPLSYAERIKVRAASKPVSARTAAAPAPEPAAATTAPAASAPVSATVSAPSPQPAEPQARATSLPAAGPQASVGDGKPLPEKSDGSGRDSAGSPGASNG